MPNRPTTAADCKRLLEEALAEVVTAADLTASLDALAGHLFAGRGRAGPLRDSRPPVERSPRNP
ncbi:hypothetical protein ACWGIR_22790 [Streptomyces albidoflavus]